MAFLAVFSLFAIACSDNAPTAPGPSTATSAAPDFGMLRSLQAQRPDLSGQYVVVLKGNQRGAFESRVQELGGAVAFSHPIGLAVVTDLSQGAAAELSEDKTVKEMYQDVRLESGPPRPA